MFWRLIKQLLRAADIVVHFREGDLLLIKVVWHDQTIFEKEIDLIKGV